MKSLKSPFGSERIVHLGDDVSAEQAQRLIDARATFSLAYMKERGWGDDPGKLSFEQILEIREQPGWQNPASPT